MRRVACQQRLSAVRPPLKRHSTFRVLFYSKLPIKLLRVRLFSESYFYLGMFWLVS